MSERLTYTVTEAAELLGISRGSAYECVRTGELPSVRLGRRVLIVRRVLDEWLTAAGPTPAQENGAVSAAPQRKGGVSTNGHSIAQSQSG